MTATAAEPATTLQLSAGPIRASVDLGADRPARLAVLTVAEGANLVRPHPLVEVFTAAERHDRMTLGYAGSSIGSRLRTVAVESRSDAEAVIAQRDALTGIVVRTSLTLDGGGLRVGHEVVNDGAAEVVLFALPTLSVRTAVDPDAATLVSGRSEWLGEGRWESQRVAAVLPELAFDRVFQPDRTGFGQSSAGGWSTGSVLPTAVLAADDGTGIGWQIESSAGWQWSLSRGDGGIVVSAGGPTEREHSGEVRLAPGASFATVFASLAVASAGGADGVFAALTRSRRALRPRAEASLPIIYNDYMNTLMGQPSTEALLPLVAAAAAAGAEYFCIDAGWFTDSTEYWGEVGAWDDAPTRFSGGLGTVLDAIRDAGMRPGIWLEPESVGLDSPMIERLPAEAFFHRYGQPVVQQRRRHLDLRHPAARAHLDAVVDRLVAEHGIAYLKLDYNIEPGTGTDAGGLAPGHGLLEHTRALREWLVGIGARHPGLLIENCASGAMRSDYHLLAVTHLQSTSDQQDAARYAAIAASAPASVLPEQAGNWAYPAAGMSDGELALTLVSGLSGRIYLAGFLDRLSPEATARVHEAVALAARLRNGLDASEPFWPLGLPGWDDDTLALGSLRSDGSRVLYVWSRGDGGRIPLAGAAEQLFPRGRQWRRDDDGALVVPPGPDAAVFLLPADR